MILPSPFPFPCLSIQKNSKSIFEHLPFPEICRVTSTGKESVRYLILLLPFILKYTPHVHVGTFSVLVAYVDMGKDRKSTISNGSCKIST